MVLIARIHTAVHAAAIQQDVYHVTNMIAGTVAVHLKAMNVGYCTLR